MKTINLQIPIPEELKISAQEAALEQGFSSVQDAVRIFLHKLSQRAIDIIFAPKAEKLSPKAEKRYLKMLHDAKIEKNWYKADSVEDFLKQLNSK
jgi:antitoxin component of RelBE/YafQ-DinJ toxin-antitoxin module